jgi:oligopeptide transport system substrate-binding protein
MIHRTSLFIASLCALFLGITAVIGQQDEAAKAPYVNDRGVTLPLDAAPPEKQVLRSFQLEGTYQEWFRTVYKAMAGQRLIAEPLMRVNKDFELLPAAAESWEPSDDGLTWYFHLRSDLVFSDGKPLTAHDFVYTLRRGADPDNAYDFEWYYRPVKNWAAVVRRELPLEALGVKALDDYTLAIETEEVCTYLPHLMIYTWVSPRQAIEKYGDVWSTKPETSISSGPFYLEEWSKADRMVLKANPTYYGPAKPYLETFIAYLFNQATQPPALPAYEAGEIDFTNITSQAELSRIKTDPGMKDQLHSFTQFGTFYLTMNTYSGIFSDIRIRQAFSHAIDRDAIMRSALQGLAISAYSMLPPGFPAASKSLNDIQRYDPELARQRLSEAGYPDGRGFPGVEMWLRGGETSPTKDAMEGIQAMLSQNLNINVEIRHIERKIFMDALNGHTLDLGLVPYGYDYADASNLLSLWMSNGRHSWRSDQFDQMIVEAGTIVGDETRRRQVYQDAERLLVEDVGAVFLWHDQVNQIWKSNIRGDALEPNKDGYRAWRWDQVQNLSTTLYFADDQGRAAPPSLWERIFGP